MSLENIDTKPILGDISADQLLKDITEIVIEQQSESLRILSDIETKLEQGHWKENDKLMIIIATHGMPKMPHLDKSHHVDTLDGSVNVDHLEKIIALTESKKVSKKNGEYDHYRKKKVQRIN